MISLCTLGESEITIGSKRLGPSNGKAFALLLYLAVERDHRVARSTLKDLLFPHSDEWNASHSVRQLLYHVRRSGVPIIASPDSVSLALVTIANDFDELLRKEQLSDDDLTSISRGFLPGYAPSFSIPFLAWLEGFRQRVTVRFLSMLMQHLEQCRHAAEWERLARVANACLSLDPLHHDATIALAQSLAMVGSSGEALSLLDRYSAEIGESVADLRRPALVLRRRIAEQSRYQVRAEPRLFGRAAELAALCDGLRKAHEGKTQLVLLHGEPGIGKSRLAAEFARFAAMNGTAVVRAAARPQDHARPLSIFGELTAKLRALPGALGCSPQCLGVLERLYSHSRQEDKTFPTQVEAERMAALLYTSINDLFDAVSAEQPLLLVIDDSHHLDDLSRGLLLDLASDSVQRRALILLTSRESHLIANATALADNLSFPCLRRLSRSDARSLLESLFSDCANVVEPEVLDSCLNASDGNPLFIITASAHYRATGSKNVISQSLRGLLHQRLDQLSGSAAVTLQAVVLLGRRSTIASLAATLDLSRVELIAALQLLERTGLVSSDGAAVRSSHDLLSEVVLERIAPAAGQLLHLHMAHTLESALERSSEPGLMWDCAEHWYRAGEVPRAVALLRSCGNHSLELGQPQYAAQVFSRAADIATVKELRLQLFNDAIRAASLADDAQLLLTAIHGHRTLQGLSLSSSKPHDDLELLEVRAVSVVGGEISHLAERLSDCVSSASASLLHKLIAARRLVYLAERHYRPDLAMSADASVRELEPSSAIELLHHRWFQLVFALFFGDLPSIPRIAASVEDLATDANAMYSRERMSADIAFALYYAGELLESQARLRESFDLAERCGSLSTAHWCACALADQIISGGDVRAGREWLEVADNIQRRLSYQHFNGGRLSAWIRLALLEGDPDHAERLLNGAERDFAALREEGHKAVSASFRVGICRLRHHQPSDTDVKTLLDTYPKAHKSNSFEECVCALWHAINLRGDRMGANSIVSEYMTARRPLHPPIIELRQVLGMLETSASNGSPFAWHRQDIYGGQGEADACLR